MFKEKDGINIWSDIIVTLLSLQRKAISLQRKAITVLESSYAFTKGIVAVIKYAH